MPHFLRSTLYYSTTPILNLSTAPLLHSAVSPQLARKQTGVMSWEAVEELTSPDAML